PESVPTVAEVMRARIPAVTLRTPVMEVARRMLDEGARSVVVASGGSDLVAGVIGDLDLLRALVEGRTEGMASDVMGTEAPATIGARESLGAAVARLREGDRALVVIDGDPPRPVGLLTAGDVAAWLARG
ncbi:MAG TPA: CBS domain-containing protein, partial [Candidatus Dormibacteraeota bacterium]|nr:CBS domain-containing protein [Candidatus Dormibacteraeota bacterium]